MGKDKGNHYHENFLWQYRVFPPGHFVHSLGSKSEMTQVGKQFLPNTVGAICRLNNISAGCLLILSPGALRSINHLHHGSPQIKLPLCHANLAGNYNYCAHFVSGGSIMPFAPWNLPYVKALAFRGQLLLGFLAILVPLTVMHSLSL